MSVAINIEFKDPQRMGPYIPVATQGTYHSIWMPIAERLGLQWLLEAFDGPLIPVEELPALIDEFRRVRADLMENPPQNSWWRPVNVERLIERVDFILEKLTELDPNEIAEIFFC